MQGHSRLIYFYIVMIALNIARLIVEFALSAAAPPRHLRPVRPRHRIPGRRQRSGEGGFQDQAVDYKYKLKSVRGCLLPSYRTGRVKSFAGREDKKERL
jgi:hypothetical protein